MNKYSMANACQVLNDQVAFPHSKPQHAYVQSLHDHWQNASYGQQCQPLQRQIEASPDAKFAKENGYQPSNWQASRAHGFWPRHPHPRKVGKGRKQSRSPLLRRVIDSTKNAPSNRSVFCFHLTQPLSFSVIPAKAGIQTSLRGDSGINFSAASHDATPRRLTFGSTAAVHPGSLAEKLIPLVAHFAITYPPSLYTTSPSIVTVVTSAKTSTWYLLERFGNPSFVYTECFWPRERWIPHMRS